MRLTTNSHQSILHNEVFDYRPLPTSGKRKSAVRVYSYECPIRSERYDDDADAEECCQGKPSAEQDRHAYLCRCPVCSEECDDVYDASDCCLWKDMDKVTRNTLAARVEAGENWAEVLEIWPPRLS